MNNKSLADEYLRLLAGLDLSYLDQGHLNSKLGLGLSGLFLPSVSHAYESAKNKIMVVGRETRVWNVLKKDEQYIGLPQYVDSAMKIHRSYFDGQLLQKRNARGRSFHNFMRRVASRSGKDGLIYSNLFCFAWKKKNPESSPLFDEIKFLSQELLKAQIRLLSPDIIILANGISSTKDRQDCFPIRGEDNVCFNPRDYANEGIPRHQLWEFDLYGKIKCFRIHHPSACSEKAEKARQFVIDLLPAA
jgi:uracil-DNA glycosylase